MPRLVGGAEEAKTEGVRKKKEGDHHSAVETQGEMGNRE